jgi:adenylate cyclase
VPEGARRLAAIVFTDIVGFATMAQADEAAALRLLDEQRALLRPLVSEHGGRVIKTLGDGFLLEFPSAVESVRCARKIQDTFHQRNESAEAHRKIVLRVGIHVGDILGDGEDIAGDAVNVAARLEPLADPGGICVSGQVIDHIRNKLPVAWQQLAAPRLKNIEAPIQVYRLHAPSDGAVAEAPGPRAGSYVRMAVLPFASLSPDPSDEFFADGLTEEVITRIAQGTVLRVVARTSVMQYKGARKGIREIGRELGVGSILEGSVRRSANTVRITVQLVDAVSEEHLWAGRFDRELTDIFALQDEIARGVSRVLQGKLVARTPPAFRSMRRGQPATPRG